MKKKLLTLTVLPALALMLVAPSAYAYGGQGNGEGLAQGYSRGQGMRGMQEGRGVRNGDRLIPVEMREEWREDCDDLTLVERQARREEIHTLRDEHRGEMEAFIGLSHEELRQLHRSGESMADVLEEQGITEDEAEAFLTEQANEKVYNIVERHDLDEKDEQTLRDRIAAYVSQILEKWFS